MKNKLLTGLLAFLLAILIITFSIGLPIYFRPFYYIQVDLYIEEYCKSQVDMLNSDSFPEVTKESIKEAFDEVMDYLTIPGRDFGTGKFPYSEEGESHFADCKGLFDLNAWAFLISLVGITVLIILNKKGVFELWSPFGMNFAFSTGAYTLGGFALIGGLVSINFSTAFTVFHKLFFPGKDNWLFNPYTDGIILMLPQNFFMNCAILIFSSIILLCLGCIAFGLIQKYRIKGQAEARGQ